MKNFLCVMPHLEESFFEDESYNDITSTGEVWVGRRLAEEQSGTAKENLPPPQKETDPKREGNSKVQENWIQLIWVQGTCQMLDPPKWLQV